MRILFIGCVESSYKQLDLLIHNEADIVGVITKQSSNFNTDFCDLSPLCGNIPLLHTNNINNQEAVEFIANAKPDVIYCFGWSQLIGQPILSIPPLGVIGNHPAELPNNRGRHPLIWALALGLTKTASTFFRMDQGADTGDIISQEMIQIEYGDYARDLYDKVTEAESRQILEFTENLSNGLIKYIGQSPDLGNTWRKRSKVDGIIDWRMSTRAIYNLVRALSEPYPGASFLWNGSEIRVWKCVEESIGEYGNIEPGKIIEVKNPKDYRIKAYDGIIHITDGDGFGGKIGEYL